MLIILYQNLEALQGLSKMTSILVRGSKIKRQKSNLGKFRNCFSICVIYMKDNARHKKKNCFCLGISCFEANLPNQDENIIFHNFYDYFWRRANQRYNKCAYTISGVKLHHFSKTIQRNKIDPDEKKLTRDDRCQFFCLEDVVFASNSPYNTL